MSAFNLQGTGGLSGGHISCCARACIQEYIVNYSDCGGLSAGHKLDLYSNLIASRLEQPTYFLAVNAACVDSCIAWVTVLFLVLQYYVSCLGSQF